LDLTSLVQSWVNYPSSNNGVLLQGTSKDRSVRYDLASAEHLPFEYRPKLTIAYTYTGPTPTSTATPTSTLTQTVIPTETSTPTATATPLPRQVSSQAVQSVLAVDGWLDDWAYVGGAPVVLTWDTASAKVPGTRVDPRDLSVSIRSMWDAYHLYFGIDVTDDVVLVEPGEPIWHSDSVEIAFDGGADGIWDPSSTYDHQFTIRSDGHVEQLGRWEADVYARAQLKGEDGGYTLEVAIPWESLVGGTPSPGMMIPVNFGIHDDDDYGTYDAYFVWEGNGITAAADFGPLWLRGEGQWFRESYRNGEDGYFGVRDTYID
jgi:hypothetical protein